MNQPYSGLHATPFHPRTAELNILNAWVERNGFTVPQLLGDAAHEALAAHFSAVLADVTPWGRLRIHGSGAARLLSAASRRDLAMLEVGAAQDIFWTDDNGGVRGIGTVARYGEENFVLESADTDNEWFEIAAGLFGAHVRDERTERVTLLLAGPYARTILEKAGLPEAAALESNRHASCEWDGLPVTVARRHRFDRYELTYATEDCVILFDEIVLAGSKSGLVVVGQDTLDLLFLEAGVPVAGLDFVPVRRHGASGPKPESLGLQMPEGTPRLLVGVEWDAQACDTAPVLSRNGRPEGRMLRWAYSHALRRMVGLANLEQVHTEGGFSIRCTGGKTEGIYAARIV